MGCQRFRMRTTTCKRHFQQNSSRTGTFRFKAKPLVRNGLSGRTLQRDLSKWSIRHFIYGWLKGVCPDKGDALLQDRWPWICSSIKKNGEKASIGWGKWRREVLSAMSLTSHRINRLLLPWRTLQFCGRRRPGFSQLPNQHKIQVLVFGKVKSIGIGAQGHQVRASLWLFQGEGCEAKHGRYSACFGMRNTCCYRLSGARISMADLDWQLCLHRGFCDGRLKAYSDLSSQAGTCIVHQAPAFGEDFLVTPIGHYY